jgi:hypothetical protein
MASALRFDHQAPAILGRFQRWVTSRQDAVNRVLILSRFLGRGHVDDTYY